VSEAHRLDISRASMSRVLAVSLLFGLLGSAVSGFLSGRLPRLMLLGAGVVLLAVAAFWFGYARSQLLYFTAVCSLPLAYGICFPLLFGLLATLDPNRAAAAGSVASLVGTAIGSPAVGTALAQGAYAVFFWGNCAALLLAWCLAAYAARRSESQVEGDTSRGLA
jgi:MFS family permease